jgi:hypothetical protein
MCHLQGPIMFAFESFHYFLKVKQIISYVIYSIDMHSIDSMETSECYNAKKCIYIYGYIRAVHLTQ